MNIFSRIYHGCIRRYRFFLSQVKLKKEITTKLSSSNKYAFVFGEPNHTNMGDNAQTYCIVKWIGKNYPSYNIATLTTREATDRILKSIRLNIRKDDLIFFHSGYHLTDLYPVKEVYCKVAKMFPDFKIVAFPQTINFIKDKQDEKFVADTFNSHGKITLLCRDEYSYSKAKQLFVNCKLLLYPDIVTSLTGTMSFSEERDGVLFCMRNDVEAFYKKEQITTLMSKFDDQKTELTDTWGKMKITELRENREEAINDLLKKYAQYKLIITDRYHGTIFSLIANTPVIVLSSTDHKLSSGVKWFPDSFYPYVQYAKNLDEASEMAIKILSNKNLEYNLPAYFEENYYSILKDKL